MATKWRILIASTVTNNESALLQFTAHETVHGPNIAPNATCTASSTYSGYSAANLNNGVLTTIGWNASAPGHPQWVELSWATDVLDLWAITLTCASGEPGRAPKAFDVQRNHNGGGWVTVWSVSDAGTYTPLVPKTFLNPNSVLYGTARPDFTYLRGRSETNPGGTYVALRAFTIHTSLAGADIATGYAAAFSSSDYSGLPVAGAFDGSAGTFWHSNNTGHQYLGVRMASGVPYVHHITLTTEAGRGNQGPVNFIFEGSGNGWTWETIFYAPIITWGTAPETKTFTNPDTSSGYTTAFTYTHLSVTKESRATIDSFVDAKEIRILDASGTNVATGGTATAPLGTYGAPYEPSKAADGNTGTKWLSAAVATRRAWQYQHTSTSVHSIQWEAADRAPYETEVYLGNDGVTFAPRGTWYHGGMQSNETQKYRVLTPGQSVPSFYRARTTSSPAGGVSAAEVELRSASGGTNLALTANISVDRLFSVDYPGTKTNDGLKLGGSLAYWYSSTLPASLHWQLPTPLARLAEAKWMKSAAGGANDGPGTVYFERSLDGNPGHGWQSHFFFTGLSWTTSNEEKTLTNPNPYGEINTQPTTAAAGGALGLIRVHVKVNGVLDPTFVGNVTATKKSGNGNLTGTLIKAAIAGVADFTDLAHSGGVGPFIIQFTPAGGDPVDSGPIDIVTPVATTLLLTPSSASLAIAGTQALSSTVFDQVGNVMGGASVAYASNATGVATVHPTTGLVTAVAPGSATITATSGSASDTSAITVAAAARTAGTRGLRIGVGHIGL